MKQYKSLIKKSLAGIIETTFLIILEALGMTFAGYSLSFFFTAYEYARDKIRALCYTFVIVTTIKSLKPCGAWKAKAAIIYNLRKKIALGRGKPTYIKTILGIGYKFASRE